MNIYSIFSSIDGEVNFYGQGSLTTFVRLAGCNLRCNYCDTVYAQEERSGELLSADQTVGRIFEHPNVGKITVTGGEPLLQPGELQELCRRLKVNNKKRTNITIETNGSILIIPWKFYGATFIADWKLPSSGMSGHMDTDNFKYLGFDDFVKFVIDNRDDFGEAINVIHRLERTGCKARYSFSPLLTNDRGQDKGRINDLAEWMLSKPIAGAILNIQLHKAFELNESK